MDKINRHHEPSEKQDIASHFENGESSDLSANENKDKKDGCSKKEQLNEIIDQDEFMSYLDHALGEVESLSNESGPSRSEDMDNVSPRNNPLARINFATVDVDLIEEDARDWLRERIMELEEERAAENVVPLYAMGDFVLRECEVCLLSKELYLRECCEKPVCDECMLTYIKVHVEQASVKIGCPSAGCDKYVQRDEVMTRLTGTLKEKFFRFLVDANKEPHIKTCPKCSSIMELEKNMVKKPSSHGLQVVCEECNLTWCFTCQAPWHNGITCKQYHRGDILLSKWAKEHQFGQANAQKCPRCKVFIQRSTGCDHMICTQCKMEFCYRCGGRFMGIKFVGDHYNRYSIFGCKYRLWPDNKHKRRFLRGMIFSGKVAVVPVLAGLAVGACAVLAAVGVVALPVFGAVKLHKWRQTKIKRKERQKFKKDYEDWTLFKEEIRGSGDPYIHQHNLLMSAGVDLSSRHFQHLSRLSIPSCFMESLQIEVDAAVHKVQDDSITSRSRSYSESNLHSTMTTDFSCFKPKSRSYNCLFISDNLDRSTQTDILAEQKHFDSLKIHAQNELPTDTKEDSSKTSMVDSKLYDYTEVKCSFNTDIHCDKTLKQVQDNCDGTVVNEESKVENQIVLENKSDILETEGKGMKSLVSQYACLGNISKKKSPTFFKRSASYETAVTDKDYNVSVKDLVKRYSQNSFVEKL